MKFFIKASFKAFKENITLMGPIVYLPSPRIWLEFKIYIYRFLRSKGLERTGQEGHLGNYCLKRGLVLGVWALQWGARDSRAPILLLAGQEWEKGVPGTNPTLPWAPVHGKVVKHIQSPPPVDGLTSSHKPLNSNLSLFPLSWEMAVLAHLLP